MYFTILLFPTFLNFSYAVEESLNVSLSPVTLFLAKIMLVFFLMAGMAWVANMSTISLFQQIKCMGRRTKSVLSYDMDLNRGRVDVISSFSHWLIEEEYQISMWFQPHCIGCQECVTQTLGRSG